MGRNARILVLARSVQKGNEERLVGKKKKKKKKGEEEWRIKRSNRWTEQQTEASVSYTQARTGQNTSIVRRNVIALVNYARGPSDNFRIINRERAVPLKFRVNLRGNRIGRRVVISTRLAKKKKKEEEDREFHHVRSRLIFPISMYLANSFFFFLYPLPSISPSNLKERI